jgi:hypothetical protein
MQITEVGLGSQVVDIFGTENDPHLNQHLSPIVSLNSNSLQPARSGRTVDPT